MNKATLILLSFLITIKIFAQNNENLRKIITMGGNDTIEIEQFDEKGNLIFHKIFPQYGISQILSYTYLDNKLTSYTWSHSNIGFIEIEYVFDSLTNTINTYSYENNADIKIPNLMSYNSIEDLKNSNEFKKYKNEGTRYLKSTQYFENTLMVKEVEFNILGGIENTFNFTYENGKLTRKKQVYGHNNSYNELIYEFDNYGNELQWMKVFNSSDTSVVYKSIYNNNELIERIGIEDNEISSKEYFEYSKGKLLTIKQYDKNGILRISSDFHYNQSGKIDYIAKVNKYMGQVSKAKYYYE
jgi:hypothetical protein